MSYLVYYEGTKKYYATSNYSDYCRTVLEMAREYLDPSYVKAVSAVLSKFKDGGVFMLDGFVMGSGAGK